MLRKISVFALVAVCLVGMLGCAEEEKEVGQSVFDFSLGEHIRSKTYEEVLEILKIDEESAQFERGGLTVGEVEYDGVTFTETLAFSVNDSEQLVLESIAYSHTFDESADEAAVRSMVEKIYAEMCEKYSAEPLTDESGTRYFEDTIGEMLAGDALGSGAAYWAATDEGCDMRMTVGYLDPTGEYRITISEAGNQVR